MYTIDGCQLQIYTMTTIYHILQLSLVLFSFICSIQCCFISFRSVWFGILHFTSVSYGSVCFPCYSSVWVGSTHFGSVQFGLPHSTLVRYGPVQSSLFHLTQFSLVRSGSVIVSMVLKACYENAIQQMLHYANIIYVVLLLQFTSTYMSKPFNFY